MRPLSIRRRSSEHFAACPCPRPCRRTRRLLGCRGAARRLSPVPHRSPRAAAPPQPPHSAPPARNRLIVRTLNKRVRPTHCRGAPDAGPGLAPSGPRTFGCGPIADGSPGGGSPEFLGLRAEPRPRRQPGRGRLGVAAGAAAGRHWGRSVRDEGGRGPHQPIASCPFGPPTPSNPPSESAGQRWRVHMAAGRGFDSDTPSQSNRTTRSRARAAFARV